MTPIRRPYERHPGLLTAVVGLLEPVFPGVGARIERGRVLGLDWSRCSTPFVIEVDGRLVSHVGLLEQQLVLDGEPTSVGVVHAVATDPAARRQGHYRRALEALLDWTAGRYATLLVNTDQPWLYEPFGFRVIPEHRFVGPVEPAGARGPALRRLDFAEPADVATLTRLLDTRAPVSPRFGVVAERDAFAFNECDHPPWLAEDLDAAVLLERDGDTLALVDLIAPVLPPLPELLARVPWPVSRVECYFNADAIAPELTPEPHRLADEEVLLARGPLPPEDAPRMLARPARC